MSRPTKTTPSGDDQPALDKGLSEQKKVQRGASRKGIPNKKLNELIEERGETNREKRRRLLRNYLRPRAYLQRVHEILDRDFIAESTMVDVSRLPADADGNIDTSDEAQESCKVIDQEMAKIKISEARLKLDGYFRLLSKDLPDMKSIEHVDTPAEREMSDHELVESIKRLHSDLERFNVSAESVAGEVPPAAQRGAEEKKSSPH